MAVGMLASVAGMLVLADGASGTPSIGQGWELTVIAGVVIGGVSLFGGVGTVAAGIVGMLLLQVVQSGLVVVGVNPNWQTVAVGLIMVLAVGVDIARRRVSLSGGSRRRRKNAAGAGREAAPAQGT
jgi:ribose transport system permease protein